jgi:hypothetical protein
MSRAKGIRSPLRGRRQATDLAAGGWQALGRRVGAAALSRAAVAAASRGASQPWWGEAARGGGLSRRRASPGLASRASPRPRGPLGCQENPLVETFLILWRSMGKPVVFLRKAQVHDPSH